MFVLACIRFVASASLLTMSLSIASVNTMLRQDYDAHIGTERVKVYTAQGTQIGIPTIGANEDRLTFPRKLLVEDVLQFQPWARFATLEELDETPAGFVQQWWRPIEFAPKTLVHCDGSVAHPDQRIGCKGCHVTAMPHCYQVPPFEVPKCATLEDINTPPTPTTPPPPSP